MSKRAIRPPPSVAATEDSLDMVPNSTLADQKRKAPMTGASKQRLFEDSGSEDESEDGGVQLEDAKAAFKINEEYAQRFKHNKDRAERQRLEEKYGNQDSEDSESSSDDETEDEDGFLLTEDLDAQMSAALRAIKNKDPRIYDTESKFYAPIDEEAATMPAKESKEAKEKPVFLQDYHRERYMAGDVGADDDEDAPMTYVQEQAALKQNLLAEINAAANQGVDGESDDEDFVKRKENPKLADNGVHPSRAAKLKITELDVANADKDPETFLSNFMASRAWKPDSESQWPAIESDDDDDEMADEIEYAWNMRFEDPSKSNEVLKSYSRTVTAERSVRRVEATGRRRQREIEKEQKAAEKEERRMERARLRKLKIDEAAEKLKKIKQAAGMSGKRLEEEEWAKFLENDWNDDEWEKEMQKTFGDNYYASADEEGVDSDGESKKRKKPKKPKWDDDIDVTDLIPDFKDEDDRPAIALTDSEGEAAEEDDSDSDSRPSKKRKTTKDHKKDRADARREARRERARIEALVDAQLELDQPAVLAGSKKGKSAAASGSGSGIPAAAPFRYRETSPNSFGLTARDILLAPSDTALNEFAGLKKLASFRDEEKKRKDRKKLGKKARLRQWRRDNFGAEFEHTGPTYGFGESAAAGGSKDGVDAVEDAVGDGERKKKKKRKRSKGVKVGTADE